jgi:predicted phage tail protein
MAKRAEKTIKATDNIGKAWSGLKAFASDNLVAVLYGEREIGGAIISTGIVAEDI